MKLKILALSFVLSCSMAHASFFEKGIEDVKANTKFTLLEGAQPSYFFNARDGRNEGALTTSILTYRCLSSDVGWSSGYDDRSVGTVLLGGQLHIGSLISWQFPELVKTLESVSPDTLVSIVKKARFGPSAGYSFSENKWVYGLIAGFLLKFP